MCQCKNPVAPTSNYGCWPTSALTRAGTHGTMPFVTSQYGAWWFGAHDIGALRWELWMKKPVRYRLDVLERAQTPEASAGDDEHQG